MNEAARIDEIAPRVFASLLTYRASASTNT
jgi:hypothetical protein